MVGKDYDEFELREHGTKMYWIGAITGFSSAIMLCLAVGLYFSN